MSDNPYEPPQAPLSDPVGPARPIAVTRASWLLYASLALGTITMLPGMRGEEFSLAANLVLLAIFGGLTVWLVHQTGQRKGWARWCLLAYLVFGWVLTFGIDSTTAGSSPLAVLLDYVCGILEVAAAWWLFTGPGARWFAGQ